MESKTKAKQAGRVKLNDVPIRNPAARKVLAGTGLGHALSPDWLPAAGVPVLGEALAAERDEHLRLLDGLRTAADSYREAEAAFAAEDAEHAEALRSHARNGGELPADNRTAPADRGVRSATLIERVDAAVVVLAEHVDYLVTVIRQREDDLTAELGSKLAPAAAKREEIERLRTEALCDEWAPFVAAKWLHATADNLGFIRQPAPTGAEPPPPGWPGHVSPDDLARHWSEHKPWNADYEPPEDMASWQESDRQESDDAPGDGTGVVSALSEGAAS